MTDYSVYNFTTDAVYTRAIWAKFELLELWPSFLPRDASAERGDATVNRLSVCPSVCLSVRNVQVP